MNPLVELNEVEWADLGNERKESVYAYVFGMLPALLFDDVDADVVDAALPLAPGCPSAAAVAATAHK
eukprot:scaffold844_cov268-Chaetoceros_neogracile.AAC.7